MFTLFNKLKSVNTMNIHKKKGGWLLPLLLAVFCITGTSRANDFYVKDNGGADTPNCGGSWNEACKTVGKALGKTGQSDTVHVAAGTYVENIDLSGTIHLLGGYPAIGGDTRDTVANSTILDGNNIKYVISARNASGIIDGFTIRNGSYQFGGGIQVIECNNLQITNNYITSNNAKSGGGIFGRINSGVEIISNTIVGNSVSWHGGGINLTESDVTVANNIIKGNTAAAAGGGAYLANNNGGGSLFEANTVDENSSNRGGGLYVHASDILIARNNIKRNTTNSTGGGLYLNDYVGTLVNCMVTENHAGKGGGLYAGSSKGSILLLNDTIADNTARIFAPGIISYNNCLTINNSIVWHNGQDFYGKGGFVNHIIYDNDGEIIDMQTVKVPLNILITDSDISDPQYANPDPAINIINEPPKFIGNGDYHLQEDSPCIDRVVSGVGPDIDIDGDNRPLDTGFDMGADEVIPPCSPKAEEDVTCDGVDDDCDGETDEEFVDPGTACDGDDADSCADGRFICSDGMMVCYEGNESKTEICNDNLDNDCDGATDGADTDCGECTTGDTQGCYTGAAGTGGVGECKDGLKTCDAAGAWGACTGEVTPVAEVCDDSKDNDCDGAVDGIDTDCGECTTSDTQTCYTGPAATVGVGECKNGSQTCDAAGNWGACTGEVTPVAEVCDDSKDNDCDGEADEGCIIHADIDSNKTINIDDVFCLFKYIMGRSSCLDNVVVPSAGYCDVNNSGNVNVDDVFCLFKYTMGRPSCLDGT